VKSAPYDDVLAQGRRGTIRVVLVGGAVAVALVVAVVALVAWAGLGKTPTTPPAAAGSTTPEPTETEPLATPGLEVVMPTDLVWQDVGGMELPYSVSTGPTNTLAGLASGFAHNAAGAVLAAAHIIIRINPELGPDVFGPTLREQVVGPAADAARTTVNDAYGQLRQDAGVPYGDPVGQLSAVLRGFRVEEYSETNADVRLVVEGPDGSGGLLTSAMLLHLRWSNDDWVLVLPAGWQFITAYVLVDADSLYTPFVRGSSDVSGG
jgi:hypothetical protein